MHILRKIALAVLIIGGINWGLIGLFDFNLVSFLFDDLSMVISRIIYSLVGISAIVTAIAWAVPDDEYSYTKSYQ